MSVLSRVGVWECSIDLETAVTMYFPLELLACWNLDLVLTDLIYQEK